MLAILTWIAIHLALCSADFVWPTENITVLPGDMFEMKAHVTNALQSDSCIFTIPNSDDAQVPILTVTKGDTTPKTTNARKGNVPEWTYYWFGDMNEVTKECGIHVSHAVVKDNGQWTYIAGTASGTFTVIVGVPPESVAFDVPYNLGSADFVLNATTQNQSVDVTCIAKNVNPLPDVVWKMDDAEEVDTSLTSRKVFGEAYDLSTVEDTLTYHPKPSHDNKILRCVYYHYAYDPANIQEGLNEASLKITVKAKPAPEGFIVEGATSPKVGESTTVTLTFHSNPEPTTVSWFMHDSTEPLGVDTNINTRATNSSTCSGRYCVGQFSHDGHSYTSKLEISEVLDSDEGKTSYLMVTNQYGTTNYTFQMENLEGGLSTGAIVGIVLGIVGALMIVALVAAVVMKKKKKSKRNNRGRSSSPAPATSSAPQIPPAPQMHERGVDNPTVEIDLSSQHGD